LYNSSGHNHRVGLEGANRVNANISINVISYIER